MRNLKIFTENVEGECISQIYTLVDQPAFEGAKIRIMPDTHAGKGAVIGFTGNLGNKVIPNIVGVDIGCGMLTIKLGKIDLNLENLDEGIKKYVPSGRNSQESTIVKDEDINNLLCYRELKDTRKFARQIGTLGGGNHFIEVDVDDDGVKYLVIHTGSRNMGKQVAEHYQDLAIGLMSGKDELLEQRKKIIGEYKQKGKRSEIQSAIKELEKNFKLHAPGIPNDLCYLEGEYRENYLHDMKICQEYASLNRKTIGKLILEKVIKPICPDLPPYSKIEQFETIHNYIDLESNIVRKGAISAKDGEVVLIPINMRDGSIIAIGKGNEDWNCSAPHGAGRLMSRSKAKEMIKMEDFENSMKGIYTTSVTQSTIDESPMAYKPMEEIIKNIKDTVEIVKIIKPIYNFKASE